MPNKLERRTPEYMAWKTARDKHKLAMTYQQFRLQLGTRPSAKHVFLVGASAWVLREGQDFCKIHPIKHGHAVGGYTTEYHIWAAMRTRCENPKHVAYHRYGGRGIKVCGSWKKFENFLIDMGRRPGPNYSLDRIDNNGDYEAANCRWATSREQFANSDHRRRDPTGRFTKELAQDGMGTSQP
jgi:hypothetical protein